MNDGIHPMTRSDYDAVEREHFSRLKYMAKCPAAYATFGAGEVSSDAFTLGIATDLAVFAPQRFVNECALWQGKVRNGGEWEKFKAANEGKHLLTLSMFESAKSIATSVWSDPVAKRYLIAGDAHPAVLWTDNGIELKGELDFLSDHNDAIVDLKTVKDASPDGFGRAVVAYEWHSQAAMYVDGIQAATKVKRPFVWIAVEKHPPFLVAVYWCDEQALVQGRKRYQEWLAALRYCRSEKRFPGYGTTELDLKLPRWATPYEEES